MYKISNRSCAKFSILSKDKNLIHLDQKFASKFFCKKRIAHGINVVLLALKKYSNLQKDKFFINENFSIHSSWLINLNIHKNFRYYLENPIIALEDYFTISYYIRRGFKFFITEKNTVLYNDHLMGHGKLTKNSVKEFYRKRIAKSLFSYYSRLYFKNSKLSKFFFILKNFGILKYLVFVLWTIDYLNLRKFIRG